MSIRLGDVNLFDVCFGIVDYAARNSFTAERVRAVF